MIGARLSDIAAQMTGHPEAATSLDKYAMKNKLASIRQQMTQAGTGNPMPGKVAAPGAINIHPAKLFGGP